jgi:hypothetical protein
MIGRKIPGRPVVESGPVPAWRLDPLLGARRPGAALPLLDRRPDPHRSPARKASYHGCLLPAPAAHKLAR